MEPSAKWAEVAAQAIFHTLVASLFVEALVRSWRVSEPRQRMALRLVALCYPLVVIPSFLAQARLGIPRKLGKLPQWRRPGSSQSRKE